MNKNEIKKSNRKALPKFIIILVISLIIGYSTGLYSAKYELYTLVGIVKNAGAFFGAYIAPWLILATAIVVPMVCLPTYRSAKKMLLSWDGENEEISDTIDNKISVVIWFTTASIILSYFLIAATYSKGIETLENLYSIVFFFVGIVSFSAIIIENIVIQQRCVDTIREKNPEKTVSFYDTKFQKKWLDSCDEAEKIIIGNCALKSFYATNKLCSILSIVLAICALLFGIGFLPSLVICLIWIVNQSIYCKETLRYSKAGNKIS